MPCRDYYDDHPEQYFNDVTLPALKQQISFAESALCVALDALKHVDGLVETTKPKSGDFYDWIHFENAGINKKDLVKWHKRHKKLDDKHREEERLRKLKDAALSKLSDEEKKALGLGNLTK